LIFCMIPPLFGWNYPIFELLAAVALLSLSIALVVLLIRNLFVVARELDERYFSFAGLALLAGSISLVIMMVSVVCANLFPVEVTSGWWTYTTPNETLLILGAAFGIVGAVLLLASLMFVGIGFLMKTLDEIKPTAQKLKSTSQKLSTDKRIV